MSDTRLSPPEESTRDTYSVLHSVDPWEVALYAIMRLGVVFALTLALILVLGHQLSGPF